MPAFKLKRIIMGLGIGTACILAAATTASALQLTGGPVVTPPGGGGCTASGTAGRGNGLTLTCTISAPGNFTDLYFGLANETSLNGMAMDGTGPSGFETFRYSSSTSDSIIYTSSSPINDFGTTQQTSTRLILTLASGNGFVIATDGTPADNGNGDIRQLFRVSGSSFTVHVDMQSNEIHHPVFTESNTGLYDTVRTSANTRTLNKLDFGFYYRSCSQ